MRVTLRFDTEALFNDACVPIFDAYFRGEITAGVACAKLGWRKELWDSQIAGIVSSARHGLGGATITSGQLASLVGHLN